MRPISRREFLRLAGGSALAAPFLGLPALGAATPLGQATLLTTLARTLQRGAALGEGSDGTYHRLAYGPGEPHVRRLDLAPGAPALDASAGRSLLHFVHYTDMQLADTQSPARVEFLDRFADEECHQVPFEAAFRPQESLTYRAFEQTIRTVNQIGTSPITGAPIRFAVCTGDNIDNEQWNELRWFIDLMDGRPVHPDSGAGGYEGVQAAAWADPEYWHPDAGVPDKYKQQWGFPEYPGLLAEAVAAFVAQGAAFPWYSCNGNHDTLMQGNAPQNPSFEAIAVGPLKTTGPPPGGNPCDHFDTLIDNPEAVFTGPARPVTADPNRNIITRRQYVEEHFRTRGHPVGHGFTTQNVQDGTAYYVNDRFGLIRQIVLDTTNPGGYSEGSIGQQQLLWLEQRLIEAHSRFFEDDGTPVNTGNRDRLVILLSHHGLESLVNPSQAPDPWTPEHNDLPRHTADVVERLVHRFPNVILWVNGHTHENAVVPRPDPEGKTNGFWDVTTSAICDWPCQTRLIELVSHPAGYISILGTMVDHDGPADPQGATGLPFVASIHRELASNDPHGGIDAGAHGAPEDRNVELMIPAPFRLRGSRADRARSDLRAVRL
jgi:metallophosphoesterase (TIGR03767 family)